MEGREKYVKENHEMLVLEAKGLGRLTEAERIRLDMLKLITKQKEIQEEIDFRLETPAKERTKEEKDRLAVLFRQSANLEKQIAQKQLLIDKTKEQATAELKVGEVIESNIQKWREFIGVINSVGRGDKDLSDKELTRKIENLEQEIYRRNVERPTRGFDFLEFQQQNELRNAQAELNLRNNVRGSAGFFGEDAAFNQFPGLSEQRFQDILADAKSQEKQTDFLRNVSNTLTSIEERLRVAGFSKEG